MKIKSDAKRSKRLGQAQIISAILITGIAVGVVSIAYVWGVPLIQKSQVATQVTNAENLMYQLETAIADIIQTGGQRSVSVTLDGQLEVSNTLATEGGNDNSIFYRIITKGANVAGSWVPMNDDNMFGVSGAGQEMMSGVLGEDVPGVIMAMAIPSGDQFQTIYRLSYRELDDLETFTGYLTQICIVGNNIAGAGAHYILIKKEEPVTVANSETPICGAMTVAELGLDTESKLGGALIVTPISVTVS